VLASSQKFISCAQDAAMQLLPHIPCMLRFEALMLTWCRWVLCTGRVTKHTSDLPCEVVGKGRDKLLEDFAKHVLSGITRWQQYIEQNQQITAFLFALLAKQESKQESKARALYVQLQGLLQSLSEAHTSEQHSNLHCPQCATSFSLKIFLQLDCSTLKGHSNC